MRQSLINRDSAVRVKREHLLNEVDGLFVCALEQFGKVLATVARQLPHEHTIVRIFDLID